MNLTVATFNIHKGFSHLTRRMVIHELRERLHHMAADVLFLQEVQGSHERHAVRYNDWPGKPQHEFIADQVWREVAYGKNAIYRHGHHGNALLSRFYRELTVNLMMQVIRGGRLEGGEYLVTEHRAIVDAFESGDLAAARTAIRTHIATGQRIALEAIERAGGLL